MTKEKGQNKVQTITLFCTFSLAIGLFVLYFVPFLWPVHCLSFILYFFFGHWIACTLFCTFSLVIGLSVPYFVLFLWPLEVQNKVQAIQ
jgi:uncharacterized membrane protein YjjP (DUF1212 family)